MKSTSVKLPAVRKQSRQLAKRVKGELKKKRNGHARQMIVRRYDAGKVDRLTADWLSATMSANREINDSLETIRNRARELEQNDDIARRYLAMVEANVVGRGFQLRLEDGADVAAAFMRWMNIAEISGKFSGPDAQRLMARTCARDGDFAILLFRGSEYPDGIGFQIIEGDLIDHNYNFSAPGFNRIVMGVEINEAGRTVACYIFDTHPGDFPQYGRKRRRVPVEDIIHVSRTERPGQTRAVSWMASSMRGIRMMHGYMEAELVASRVSSCKMGFYKIPPGEEFSPDGTDQATGAPVSDASPGSFERIGNLDFQPFDPQHPTTQFGAFVKACLRLIAGGLGVAYNNLANDLDSVSYSSIRSGTIEEREQWIVTQEWFARAAMHPLFQAWLKMAASFGAVAGGMATYEKFKNADKWTGRRWKWVDPQSDIAAEKERIALKLTTPSMLAAEQGEDYEAICRQMKADEAVCEKNGLPPILSTVVAKPSTPVEPASAK